jgi:hypothetical protein
VAGLAQQGLHPDGACMEAAAAVAKHSPNMLLCKMHYSYFRQSVARGPHPQAAHWSALDLATMLRQTVLQSSLQLNLQRMQLPPEQHSELPVSKLWERCETSNTNMCLCPRQHRSCQPLQPMVACARAFGASVPAYTASEAQAAFKCLHMLSRLQHHMLV